MEEDRSSLIGHNREFYAVLKNERSRFHVVVPELWRDYKPFRALEMRKSLIFAYLKWNLSMGAKRVHQRLGGSGIMWLAQIFVLWC